MTVLNNTRRPYYVFNLRMNKCLIPIGLLKLKRERNPTMGKSLIHLKFRRVRRDYSVVSFLGEGATLG